MSAGAARPQRMRGWRASLNRIAATFIKEVLQLSRDRITFAMMVVIPLVQLLIFGYAINTNPRHLPTAVLIQDDSAFARSFLSAMRATDYFDIRAQAQSDDPARRFWAALVAELGRSADEPYDLLLLDYDLPHLNGLELARQALRLPHRKGTPIVMLTASEVEAEALSAGVAVFMRKPDDVRRLAETTARLLTGEG